MAGTGFATKYFIGDLLFILLFFPLTRGVLYLPPPNNPPPQFTEEFNAPPPNNPPPKFTEEFNVQVPEGGRRFWESAYRTLIESLRTRLRFGSRWGRLGLPVLHPQAPDGQVPTQWFHLVLRYDDALSITLRMRGDNLYVVGYQRGGSDQWLECRNHGRPALIQGSQALGFSCNYEHLQNAAGQTTATTGLGRYRLRDAVHALARDTTGPNQHRTRARSLIVIILMLSEATRFPNIAELSIRVVGGELPGSRDPQLSEEMDALTRAWSDISDHLIRADQDPDDRNTFPLSVEREQGVAVVVLWTAQQAAALLGMLLLRNNCRPRLAGPILGPVEGGGGGHCGDGRPLMEVISVIMNDLDGEDPGDLYGTIRVTDGLGPQSIYDRDKYNYEYVYPGKAATLTGPPVRAISAMASITIDLDLWDRDFTAGNPDDQVSKGRIDWDHLEFRKRYDTQLSQTVTGTYGSATVNYIVFSDAVEAKFEVTLVRGNDGQQDEVYGSIVARIGDLGIESVLLSSTTSNYAQVWYGDLIPLQRTIVAVPLSSYIRVSALLYDYDSSSADDEIAGGCTYFGAKSSGTTRWRVTGLSGEIEIKVTWNPSY